jgi:hypothetical protein
MLRLRVVSPCEVAWLSEPAPSKCSRAAHSRRMTKPQASDGLQVAAGCCAHMLDFVWVLWSRSLLPSVIVPRHPGVSVTAAGAG